LTLFKIRKEASSLSMLSTAAALAGKDIEQLKEANRGMSDGVLQIDEEKL